MGEQGALDQLQSYLRELEEVGRVHGVRLNLRFRDPVFATLIAHMQRLQHLIPRLQKRAGQSQVAELQTISEVLNRNVYDALGDLLTEVCVLPIQQQELQRVWKKTCSEWAPEFELPQLELELAHQDVEVRKP